MFEEEFVPEPPEPEPPVPDFWSWVASEVKQAHPRTTLEDVVAWLEHEKAKSENLIFSYSLRNEPLKAAYEEGRLEVINEVLRRLRRVAG